MSDLPSMASVKADLIERALVAADGSPERAAKLIGISYPTVYRFLRKKRLHTADSSL